MSVKIFDTHAIQTNVLFNTKKKTKIISRHPPSIPTHTAAVDSTTTIAMGTTTLTTSMETVDGSELCHYPPLTHSCRSRGSSCCAVTMSPNRLPPPSSQSSVQFLSEYQDEGGGVGGGGLPSCYWRRHRHRVLGTTPLGAWGGAPRVTSTLTRWHRRRRRQHQSGRRRPRRPSSALRPMGGGLRNCARWPTAGRRR